MLQAENKLKKQQASEERMKRYHKEDMENAEQKAKLDREHVELEKKLEFERIKIQRENDAMRLREQQKIELEGLEAKLKKIAEILPTTMPALLDSLKTLGEKQIEADIKKAKIRSKADIELAKIKWAGVLDSLKSIGSGIKDFTGDKKRMAITVGAIIMVISACYGLPVFWRYIESVIKKPRIVSETSRSMFGSKEIETSIEDTIVDPATKAQLMDIVDRITMSRDLGENLFNVMFYGAPGTGKTMFARALAHHSGLDYAIMSGSEFTKITDTNVAIGELQKLIRWAEKSPKGLVVFIDEAESFLSDRTLPTTTKWGVDMLNAFLAAVPKPTSKKVMFIFATNHPFKLDQAVWSRIGERIEFKLPELPEREKILKMYIEKFAMNRAVTVSQDLLNNISAVASKLDGISPREIEYISEKMVQTTSLLKKNGAVDSQLTLQVALQVTDIMKAEIQKVNAWDIEKKNWVEKTLATSH